MEKLIQYQRHLSSDFRTKFNEYHEMEHVKSLNDLEFLKICRKTLNIKISK